MEPVPTVFVLDDDEPFVRSLERQLRVEGFTARTWTSAREFLKAHDPSVPGCLLIDLCMPEMSGLELQRQLRAQGCFRPLIFITGLGDMNSAVEGMRAGAVTFLPKPVPHVTLIEILRGALAVDAAARVAQSEKQHVRDLIRSLTPRERQVLRLVAHGQLNKQIAGEFGIAEKTIKVHRGRVMHKMQVKSAAALAQMLNRVEISSEADFAMNGKRTQANSR